MGCAEHVHKQVLCMSCAVFKLVGQTAVLDTHVSILGPLTIHLEHILISFA